ncbi:hypothetical protein CONCODRAFT_79918 [Conidiobolus coronatus NRRL 28638]|uniref:Uncharacterized protein n=1 Tax=Conidiobolus coronatus (strain ATCC 28846 / CBS 209.66 / NRRL 28638) TaxID=796925 RepID=A0A137NZR4_CONC2|nr:hypothetical protein CONCODRAFT_79918 [Conidiobolus coronatus NRRL 28638]|eukprot:KXN68094.1 hypothetical protein CONCODRAFT_79918 [Conidiobolus coronatus NRRL 28638]
MSSVQDVDTNSINSSPPVETSEITENNNNVVDTTTTTEAVTTANNEGSTINNNNKRPLEESLANEEHSTEAPQQQIVFNAQDTNNGNGDKPTTPKKPKQKAQRTNIDISAKGAIVALKGFMDLSASDVAKIMRVSQYAVENIYANAIKKGFNPFKDPPITDELFESTPSTKPKKQTSAPLQPVPEVVKDAIMELTLSTPEGIERGCDYIVKELRGRGLKIGRDRVTRIMNQAGYYWVKSPVQIGTIFKYTNHWSKQNPNPNSQVDVSQPLRH